MSDKLLKLQCPSCGAAINYDIGSNFVVCGHCESKYPIDFFNIQNKSVADEKGDWRVKSLKRKYASISDLHGLACTACGAEVVNNSDTVATECMYCGNALIVVGNVKGMLQPDKILPFKIKKDEAQASLKNFCNKKILLPSEFKDLNKIDKIVGMYVPFWLFSGKGVLHYTFEPNQISRFRQGDYMITKTQHYEFDMVADLDYINLPVNASSRTPDDYMGGLEPFEFDELKNFSTSYMAGFYAEKFDNSVDECTQQAKDRIFYEISSDLLGQKGIYMEKRKQPFSTVKEKGHTHSLQNEDIKYVLLPVWMLNTRYKGKMYHFAVNGQTGKVSGELPIDKTKQILLFLSMFIGMSTLFSMLTYLIILFFGGL